MKLAFSTLGCPEWSWEDILSTAKDFGFNGLEVRGIEHEIYTPLSRPFLYTNKAETLKTLDRLKLEIPCLSTACYLYDKTNYSNMIKEGEEYIDLANSINTPFVRVLGDKSPEPNLKIDIDDEFVIENLRYLAAYAAKKNVKIIIETNGVYADSKRIAKIVNKAAMPNIGILWDVHHPYRYFSEMPMDTYNNIGEMLSFVHVKDSIINADGSIKYKMMGSGDVPVVDTISILKKYNYTGYISLEWVKRWYLDLEEPGVAFMQFVEFMKRQLGNN